MNLTGWLHRRRDPPVSPVPEAAREVQKQADELHRIVLELRRIEGNERKA